MQQPNTLPGKQISGEAAVPVPPGALDGITIMRYAHIYRDRVSGGVEQYLQHLDHRLLQRHRLTILQTYLTKDGASEAIQIENVGLGRIWWIPVPILHMDSSLGSLPSQTGHIYREILRLRRLEGEGQYHAKLSSLQNLLRHQAAYLRYGTTILSDHLSYLLRARRIDLLALHWLSYDTGALITNALRARVPFAFINHFDNARFLLPQTRKWITHAAAIGCVSEQGVPDDLRDRTVNLSDAVDTEFFAPEKARPIGPPAGSILLLPGRIDEGKGHHDLVEAARILVAMNADVVLCFAGAVESEPLHQELRSAAAGEMKGRILFLGEISAEELRDWYGRCSMVVLPSYSEGLPRVVLEAQAMERPVVAYDSSGTSKAILSDETGFLVTTGDVEALADQIRFLLEDVVERRRLGEHGRKFVSRNFSLSAVVARHEAFYLSALREASLKQEGQAAPQQHVHRLRPIFDTPALNRRLGGSAGPLVSILIPAANAQRWIADTLRSAIAQTWEQKEIIVVDDGSTDQTLAIARQFESDCVRVFSQKNQGASAARNLAFSLSRGEYIQWLDADDLLAPDKIARQMQILDRLPSKRILLSSAWGRFMYRYYRARFIPTALWCDLSPVEWLLRKMGQNLFMQTASWLVSRELTEAAGEWDIRLLSDDDGEYFCRVLCASDGVQFVPDAKAYYRGPGLAFRGLSYIGRSSRKLHAHWLSMQLHIRYLRSLEDSERVRHACLRYLQTSLIYFYPDMHDIINQAEQMAKELGGKLGPARLSWKYSWMKTIFGWHAAKRGQEILLNLRWSLEKLWDYLLFRAETDRLAVKSPVMTLSDVASSGCATLSPRGAEMILPIPVDGKHH